MPASLVEPASGRGDRAAERSPRPTSWARAYLRLGLRLLLVAVGLNAGFTKFGAPVSLDIARQMGVPLGGWAGLGALQIAGAVLLVWPRSRRLARLVYVATFSTVAVLLHVHNVTLPGRDIPRAILPMLVLATMAALSRIERSSFSAADVNQPQEPRESRPPGRTP